MDKKALLIGGGCYLVMAIITGCLYFVKQIICSFKGGDTIKLYPHQENVLQQLKDKNRCALYLDMG